MSILTRTDARRGHHSKHIYRKLPGRILHLTDQANDVPSLPPRHQKAWLFLSEWGVGDERGETEGDLRERINMSPSIVFVDNMDALQYRAYIYVLPSNMVHAESGDF